MAQLGVTIAIPNWNHEVVLPRAIRSAMRTRDLLLAEGRPVEVLVVDDASNDGSTTLLRQFEALYCKDGLRCLNLGTAAGLAAARNEAAHHGRYPYLVLLGASDELIPENLSLFVRTLEETGAAAAFGNLMVRSTTADYAHSTRSCESIQKRLFRGESYVDSLSVWDRLQLLDTGGFDESLSCLEDYEMWLHLAASGRRIVFVPAVLGYHYLMPSESQDRPRQDAVHSRLQRIFDQARVREYLPLNTNHLRYHPELGYI